MKLLSVTLYKLKIMFSDRLLFAAMIIIPVLIIIAAGYALRQEKLNVIPVAIVDEDNSEYSNLLLSRLSQKEGLQLVMAEKEAAFTLLKNSAIEGLFVIKKGFSEKIISGGYSQCIEMVKSPVSFSADYVSEVVAGEVMRFITANMAAAQVTERYKILGRDNGKDLYREVLVYADSQWEPEPLMTISYEEMEGERSVKVEHASMPAAVATSAGIVVVFIMFYTLFSSGWLVEERVNGTLKRLMSSPGVLKYSFAANILALALAAVLQVALFSAIIWFAFGIQLFTGLGAYILLVLYIFSVISVSLLLSAVLKTPVQLQAGAPVIALLTGFAGGCFWNFVDVPERLQQLALFTPQGWVLEGINKLLAGVAGMQAILMPALVLFLISLILIPISYIIISKQAVN